MLILGSVDILRSEFAQLLCHPSAGWGSALKKVLEMIEISVEDTQDWVPACAGMTQSLLFAQRIGQ